MWNSQQQSPLTLYSVMLPLGESGAFQRSVTSLGSTALTRTATGEEEMASSVVAVIIGERVSLHEVLADTLTEYCVKGSRFMMVACRDVPRCTIHG